MFCPSCGTSNDHASQRCLACNAALPPQAAPSTPFGPPATPASAAGGSPGAAGYQPPYTRLPPLDGRGMAQQPRGAVTEPPFPYPPESFASLYLWYAILTGVGIVTAVFLIGIPVLIAALVLYCVLIYKAWNQIQDGHQQTSAGMAVGLTFVPFFGFYWMFVAVWGLSKDLNAYTRRYAIPAPVVNEGLALTYCILCCVSIIPYLGFLTLLAALVIQFVMLNEIKAVSMAIAHAKLGRAGLA